jgi:hypothetical protein
VLNHPCGDRLKKWIEPYVNELSRAEQSFEHPREVHIQQRVAMALVEE